MCKLVVWSYRLLITVRDQCLWLCVHRNRNHPWYSWCVISGVTVKVCDRPAPRYPDDPHGTSWRRGQLRLCCQHDRTSAGRVQQRPSLRQKWVLPGSTIRAPSSLTPRPHPTTRPAYHSHIPYATCHTAAIQIQWNIVASQEPLPFAIYCRKT